LRRLFFRRLAKYQSAADDFGGAFSFPSGAGREAASGTFANEPA
jgi:hypothetical protein